MADPGFLPPPSVGRVPPGGPPRIPRLLPEAAGVTLPPQPSLDPQGLAELSTRGTRAIARSLGQVAETVEHIDRVRGALKDQAAGLEAEQALGRYDREAADRLFALRADPTITPEEYPQRVEQELRTARDRVGKTIRMSEAIPRFELGAERKFNTDLTKAKYDALERRLALNKTGMFFLNREDENTMVFGTPEQRKEAAANIVNRLNDGLNSRSLTPDEYDREMQKTSTNVALGDVLHAVQTAVQQQQRADASEQGILSRQQGEATEDAIIAKLETGGFPVLAPDAQVKLAETLSNRREARKREQVRIQEKNDAKIAKDLEAEREVVTDGFRERAARGDLSHEELNQAVQDRKIKADDAPAIRKAIYDFQGDATKAAAAASAAGGKTDDAVYNRIELDILSRSRAVSRQEIRKLQEQGKLAASGPRSAATLLKMVEDAAVVDGGGGKDITKDPMFDQGLDDIKFSLRNGKGVMSDLTDVEMYRMRNAVRQYHDIARSGKVPPSQLPEVARKIVDQAIASTPKSLQAMQPATAAQQLLYRNPADLLAAKKAGLIPDAEFNRQYRLMEEAGLINPSAGPTPSTPTPAPAAPKDQRGGRR